MWLSAYCHLPEEEMASLIVMLARAKMRRAAHPNAKPDGPAAERYLPTDAVSPARNSPCPCGSGVKAKFRMRLGHKGAKAPEELKGKTPEELAEVARIARFLQTGQS
jgi:hypothetical protein